MKLKFQPFENKKKLAAGAVLVSVGIVLLLGLASVGGTSLGRSAQYLDPTDYDDDNEDLTPETNDPEETTEETSEETSEETTTETTTTEATTVAEGFTVRPTVDTVERPTDETIWGGLTLDSMPQDKDTAEGPQADPIIAGMTGEYHLIRSQPGIPGFPTWQFDRPLPEWVTGRLRTDTFKIWMNYASWTNSKGSAWSAEERQMNIDFWQRVGGSQIKDFELIEDVYDMGKAAPSSIDSCMTALKNRMKKLRPELYEEIMETKGADWVCIICPRRRGGGSGGKYVGRYSRVLGAADGTARHESGHRYSGHSTQILANSKGTYLDPVSGSCDSLCRMAYRSPGPDGFSPPIVYRANWFKREENSFRYIRPGETYKMNCYHNWNNDGRTHCLVALSPWTGEYVFYKISMIGWPNEEAAQTWAMRRKDGENKWNLECSNASDGHLMDRGKTGWGWIRWVTYLSSWYSTSTDNAGTNIRDGHCGGGTDWVDPNLGLRFVTTNANNDWENYQCDVTVTFDQSLITRKLPPQITKVETAKYLRRRGSTGPSDYISADAKNEEDEEATALKVTIKNPNSGKTRPFFLISLSCKTAAGWGYGGTGNYRLKGGEKKVLYFQAMKGNKKKGDKDVAVIHIGETLTRRISFTHK